MKLSTLKLLTLILSSLLFSACAATAPEKVNPNQEEVSKLDAPNKALRTLIEKEAYLKGLNDGTANALNIAKEEIAEIINELRAKQMTIYLIKEQYLEAGPTYINPTTGAITFTKPEIRYPFTIADIFARVGNEIPVKSEKEIKEELSKVRSKIKKIKSSVSPTIFKQKKASRVIDKINYSGIIKKMYNTSSNKKLLVEKGIVYSTIDDIILIKFQTQKDADNFCNSFGCIR